MRQGSAHFAAYLHGRCRLAALPVHLVARHNALQQPRAAAHLSAQLLHGGGGIFHNILDVGNVPAIVSIQPGALDAAASEWDSQ